MDRFEHRSVSANIGRTSEAYRPRDLRSDIRENISIQVRHDDHIEDFGGIGELGRSNIDDPALIFYSWVFFSDLVEDLMEKSIADLHDVVFHKARHFFSVVMTGIFKSVAYDFFRPRPRDQF